MRNRKRKRIITPTLDLHGIKHADAEILVEDFILKNPPPVYVITGNSDKMKSIVESVLKTHDFLYMESYGNSGSIYVYA